MTSPAEPAVGNAEAGWNAVLRGDRDAFQAMVTPHVGELLKAARRELRYRLYIGDVSDQDLTPAEIVSEALARAWRDRRRRPPSSIRAWLLAELFKAAEVVIRREARQKRELTTVSFEDLVPPEPVLGNEEPFELAPREEVLGSAWMTPEDVAAADERRVHALPPRMREVFILHELHRVPLHEVAVLLVLSETETARLLAAARRRFGSNTGRTS